MTNHDVVTQNFVEHFGEMPQFLVRAPGRVNLIGEHTDYNDGFVMPLAIDRAIWLALRPTENERVTIHSLDFETAIQFDIHAFEKASASPAEYVKGSAWALKQAGFTIKGFEAVMKGDIPIGAGLSSSAALELAILRAFATVSAIRWHPAEMARLAQKVENLWVGVSSGIMDQMISAAGQAGHALLIDCRTLDFEALPVPQETAIVILDTGTRRKLVDSAYNARRQECEQAAKHFGVDKLRDVSLAQVEAGLSGLDDVAMRRARHVITENYRVQQAKNAMLNHDALALGRLLNASHVSLRDDFEVSSDALNRMVSIAANHNACYGARMVGAGFGGCAIALVKAKHVADFVEKIRAEYQAETTNIPAIYVCKASNGVEVINQLML